MFEISRLGEKPIVINFIELVKVEIQNNNVVMQVNCITTFLLRGE